MLLIKIPVQYSGLTKIGDEAADSTNKASRTGLNLIHYKKTIYTRGEV
ncbi:Uncharacterised protein [Neisseria meningitidis]|nr:Uncharacterised protein [Neisseria meningitidis]